MKVLDGSLGKDEASLVALKRAEHPWSKEGVSRRIWLECKWESGAARKRAAKLEAQDAFRRADAAKAALRAELEEHATVREIRPGEQSSIRADAVLSRAIETVGWLGLASASDVVDIALEVVQSMGWKPSREMRADRRAMRALAAIAIAERPTAPRWTITDGPPPEETARSIDDRAAATDVELGVDWEPGEDLEPEDVSTIPEAFRLRSFEFDSELESAPPSWLIKGVMAKSGLGLLYGESTAGKTFLAVHMALCVAWGLPFFGRKVKQGGVLFLAAEGGASVGPRFKAANEALKPAIRAENFARKALGLPSLTRAPIHIVTEPPNLSNVGVNANGKLFNTINHAARRMVETGYDLRLAVIDTWHSALGGGDENSASEVGAALEPLRRASSEGDFLTLIVHHPGKVAGNGARGSYALPAAVDTMIELSVPGREGFKSKSGGLRRAEVLKVRDGEAGFAFSYALPVIELGVDEDGEPWTTCVVEPVETAPTDADGLAPTDRDLMSAFLMVATEGRARVAEVRQAFFLSRAKAKPEAVRKAFARSKERLLRAEQLMTDPHEREFWLPE